MHKYTKKVSKKIAEEPEIEDPKANVIINKENSQQKSVKKRDHRIPLVGSIITRKYKGEMLEVKVLENGFEYKGQVFKSISGVAVSIVGGPINGYTFFKL